MNRRSILGLFGSLPFAGKKLAEEAAERMGAPLSRTEELTGDPNIPLSHDPDGEDDVFKHLLKEGIPQWKMDLIEKSVSVRFYDPDLASLCSMSPAVRYQLQKQRNIQKDKDILMWWRRNSLARKAWGKMFNLNPWSI